MSKAALFLACLFCVPVADSQILPKLRKPPEVSPLDQYVTEAHNRIGVVPSETPGSLWSPSAVLSDLAVDLRARAIDDVVTILVNEQATAVASGVTKTSRASSANASVNAALGPLSSAGRLPNLLKSNSAQSLDGQGTTSRQSNLTATLTARVVDVLPNGYLVVEGSKTTSVNSENQVITIRGVVRPADLTTANIVSSASIGQLELKINGKGVVNDAVRRPNFLYRLLLGILPF